MLRGIDAQIMMMKAAVLTAEQAKALKQSEKQIEQAAEQARRQVQMDRNRALAAERIKGGKISPDDGHGAVYVPSQKFRRKKKDPDEEPGHLARLPAEAEEKRTIDVKL